MNLRDEMESRTRAAIHSELARVWEFADEVPRPDVIGVLNEALADAARDLDERADDLAECNHVDDCTAKAIALRALAERLRHEAVPW